MKSKMVKIIGGILIMVGLTSAVDSYFEISKNIDVFSALFKEVNTYYVDDV
jgi:carboxyl-terminal processing protease